MHPDTVKSLTDRAISRARRWQEIANRERSAGEKAFSRRLERLLAHPEGKAAMVALIDQSFRPKIPVRVADQIAYIFRIQGVPEFFSAGERLLVHLFLQVGRHFPGLSVPGIIGRMRRDSRRSIISGHPPSFNRYLHRRRKEDVRLNINHLGEAVLGEREAKRHLDTYLRDLENPSIECISVKVSSLYSQITPLSFEHALYVLRERLVILYRQAERCRYLTNSGEMVPKFVNLDMEGYQDVTLTVTAFQLALDTTDIAGVTAGIALQAYLPDAPAIQEKLTAWAEARVRRGGAPVYLRIVKGANLEMEKVESAIRNWPLPTFDNKPAVDANFKRMVAFGMDAGRPWAVHLGIASHNLFDIAWARELSIMHQVEENVTFEMLEGMADHVRRTVQADVGRMLLYSPVADRDNFISAIAYLVRRLDENTGPDNFLRHVPKLQPGSESWQKLEQQFLAAVQYGEDLPALPYRTQNRLSKTRAGYREVLPETPFTNEPDTDFSISQNRLWAEGIREKWRKSPGDSPVEIPIAVAGKELFSERQTGACIDSSRVRAGTDAPEPFAEFVLATEEDAVRAVRTADADPDGWRILSQEERRRVFARVAMLLRERRGDLIGAAAAESGKLFTESDPEVSEAIDFVEYYPRSADDMHTLKNISIRPLGTGLVIAPWNFPIAIPCGGITAALSAGNTVIFKPSSQSVLTAHILCRCFWDAGISKNTLQFLPCRGDSVAKTLTLRPEIDFIIFTGGTDTAMGILAGRPGVRLAAETGGKNATIVTAMADRDQAILNVTHSAFSNTGQKCSATSLLILEGEVYDDENFKARLVDAVESLNVGTPWSFESRMGPLVRPPSGKLLEALTRLLPGESWALQPRQLLGNPFLWTPGIKWGVQPGSVTHTTEFFGPVLGVMRADNLASAIELVNRTDYGLTSGLESLDTREQAWWQEHIRAGNLYINRGTTGAVVLRQPFGGMGKSALGAGIKAGGPNYVSQFMAFTETGPPKAGPVRREHRLFQLAREWEEKLRWGQFQTQDTEHIQKICRAIRSYLYRFETVFSGKTDFFHIRGQDNLFRYLPVGRVVARLHEKDTLFDVLARVAATEIAGCRPEVSIPSGMASHAADFLHCPDGRHFLSDWPVTVQDEEELAALIPEVGRVRYGAPDRVPEKILRIAASSGSFVARSPVLMEGRLELLCYLREQSICHNFHRYGNLGERAIERSDV